MTPEQKAYLAGIIDGEGSISLVRIKKNEYPAPMISITSTDKELLTWIIRVTGTGTMIKKKNFKPFKHKCSYAVNIKYRKAIAVLKEIIPYLVIERKKKRANLILNDYIKLTPRNGRYSHDQRISKEQFYKNFISI